MNARRAWPLSGSYADDASANISVAVLAMVEAGSYRI